MTYSGLSPTITHIINASEYVSPHSSLYTAVVITQFCHQLENIKHQQNNMLQKKLL